MNQPAPASAAPAADALPVEELDADHLVARAEPGTLPLALRIEYCDRFGNDVDREVRELPVHQTEQGLVATLRLTHMARMA